MSERTGKKSVDPSYRDGVRGLPGMDSGGKIDGSSEDPSGDQFAGKGRFKPGKGPGGGVELTGGYTGPTPTTVDEAEVMEMLAGKPTEKQVADKEKQLQDKALDAFDLQQAIVTGKAPDPPKPKKGDKKSSVDGKEGGSEVHAVSQEEFDAVIEEVDGSQDLHPGSRWPTGCSTRQYDTSSGTKSKGRYGHGRFLQG